ncbi:hypothetical protein [Sphingomonas sp. CARO-RG-8B-R24-01]|uniref:hypothetical protein n=1 Tax=Sphingomonas sp. CARO-RG-8B-R24-01 TaxID=2914831 RepID=UPI001F5ADE60|nr:hypothetical protein [Sphingomonas sp. CARO-RG-8B-R24-01]
MTDVRAPLNVSVGEARRLARRGRWLVVAIVYLIAMALFFRGQILSGFDLGFSDRADGLIEISILEHWRAVFAGAANWNVTGYFAPYPDTLGYNDGYLLYGVVYSFWRLFADPLLADTLTIATFKTIGFFAAYRLVVRVLGWERLAGLMVAMVFTNANGLMVQAGHAQVQTVALLPVAMILAFLAAREARGRRPIRGGLWAMALALLMAAWLLTAYYMAWFTLVFATLFALCWMMTSGNWRPSTLRRVAAPYYGVLAVGLASFAVALIPFLALYLPKMRESGGRAYPAAFPYLVLPGDVLNVGPSNYVWGWLFGASPGGEHSTGIAPFLFLLAVAALWRSIAAPSGPGQGFAPPLWRAAALAVTVSWLMTIRVGTVSGWAMVSDLVPGARGLRVVSRYQLFLVLPLLLIVTAVFRQVARRAWRRRPVILAAVLTLLVAEEFGSDVPVQLSRTRDGAVLAAAPAPPAPCRTFYVVSARRGDPPYGDAAHTALYPHNVDAMYLAARWTLPTINGFSSINPPDWDFANPRDPDYDLRVANYAARHAIEHLCRLDMARPQPWTEVDRGYAPLHVLP